MRKEPFFSHVRLRREELSPGTYPLSIPAVRDIETIRFHPAVTVFAGENGSGKSTLIEALAVAAGFNPEGGTKGYRTPQASTDLSLSDALSLARSGFREKDGLFLRGESAYALFNYNNAVDRELDEIDVELEDRDIILSCSRYGDYHLRSHGESFFDLFHKRFSDARNHLFILDEVESALSPQRQLEFLALMHRHVGRGSSFIVSTHSPILMAYPRSRLYWLDKTGIMERHWKETDHFKTYLAFLSEPDMGLGGLFA
ncbi:AAA family ATPase [bacterium]|nr:MAG: AAA family ATPase [bacterium]